MDKNICNICKIRAYIECDLCEAGVFFCSRGHLNSHKIKMHDALQNISSCTGTAASVINRKQKNEDARQKHTHNNHRIFNFPYLLSLTSFLIFSIRFSNRFKKIIRVYSKFKKRNRM